MQSEFERAQEELNDQLMTLQKDRDDSLIIAENEKQQVRTRDLATKAKVLSCRRRHAPRGGVVICYRGEIPMV